MHYRIPALVFSGMLLLCAVSSAEEDVKAVVKEIAIHKVVKNPGVYRAPGGTCEVTLTRDTGEVSALSVMRGGSGKFSRPIVVHTNVNALAWLTPEELVYSALPGYGVPGLFSFSCTPEAKGKEKRLVRAKTKDALEPEGTDFFELHAVAGGKIRFYYAPDADDMGLRDVPGPEMLYQVSLDGSQFERAR